MRSELENFELIDRYLNNQLSGEALADFERKMKSDPAFQVEVRNHRLLHEMVMDQGLIEVRKKLQAIHHAQTVKNNHFKRWGAGAGIVLIVALSLLTYSILTTDTDPISQSKPAANEQKIAEKKSEAKVLEETPEAAKPLAEEKKEPAKEILKNTTAPSSVPDLPKPSEEIKAEIPAAGPDTLKFNKTPGQPVTSPLPEKKIADCHLETSLIRVTAIESCSNSPTGKIVIEKGSDIKGKSPFMFSTDNKNYSGEYMLTALYPGSYRLTIRDAAGCSWEYEKDIVIGEKDCRIPEYAFSPGNGEVWKIPIDQGSNGNIEIYSKNGARVFSAVINNGYPDTWDGTSGGQALPMGNYSFILKSGDEVLTGSVTILR
jgi:hypothetical protein